MRSAAPSVVPSAAPSVAPPGAATPMGLPPRVAARGLVLAIGGERLIDIPVLEIAGAGPTMILGHNGAGKSLLLRLLHGLLRPTAGHVAVGPGRQAMVFQRPVVLRRSVAGNIGFALRAAGVPRGERRNRIAAALAAGGFTGQGDRPARLLSVGEQQRLALVRALATRPATLFLDEPTASLDPGAAAAIEALVLDAAAAGVRIVMVTHDPAQARRMGARIGLIHRGTLAEMTETAVFFAEPRSDAARAYLREAFLLPQLSAINRRS